MPVITRAMSYRQFLIELCECFDGHPTSDAQGRLGLALVRAPGEVTAPLADADLVEPPDFDPQGWPDTFNETYVRFTNRDRKFKEDSVAYRDRGNFQVTQAIRSQVLSRPWVTRAAVATKIAWAAAFLPPLRLIGTADHLVGDRLSVRINLGRRFSVL